MVFLVILIASFVLQLVLPWWILIIIAFVTCGLIGKTAGVAFWHPFLAILICWTGMSLFKSLPNQNMLVTRIAEMFSVRYWPAILVLSGLLGSLVAGISGYCGYQFRKAVLANKSQA